MFKKLMLFFKKKSKKLYIKRSFKKNFSKTFSMNNTLNFKECCLKNITSKTLSYLFKILINHHLKSFNYKLSNKHKKSKEFLEKIV